MEHMRQPELITPWGAGFYGKAKTATGHVWYCEDEKGKAVPLLPKNVLLQENKLKSQQGNKP